MKDLQWRHSRRILSCPPTSQICIVSFLYSTVSTLKPMVGMDDTVSPSFRRYSTVDLPAASRPSICSQMENRGIVQTTHAENSEAP